MINKKKSLLLSAFAISLIFLTGFFGGCGKKDDCKSCKMSSENVNHENHETDNKIIDLEENEASRKLESSIEDVINIEENDDLLDNLEEKAKKSTEAVKNVFDMQNIEEKVEDQVAQSIAGEIVEEIEK